MSEGQLKTAELLWDWRLIRADRTQRIHMCRFLYTF